MKWKVPANPIKFNLTRHKQETRQRQQRPQNVVSSSAPVAPTVTNPFEKFGLGWDHDTPGVYEHPSTVKYIHDDNALLGIGNADVDYVDFRDTEFTDVQGNKVKIPAAYSQYPLNSCTANALAFCYEFDMLKQKKSFGPNKLSTPSRLFIYYYERAIENRISLDKGAWLHDGIQVLLKTGVCSETDWPYDATKYSEKPDKNANDNANAHKTTNRVKFEPLDITVENFKKNLKLGFPIAFGFRVYDSFYTINNNNNIMPIPAEGDTFQGGHAAVIVGFKEAEKVFIVRNSWGNLLDNGYFYMPYEIIDGVIGFGEKKGQRYVSDIWSITEVS